MDTNKFSTMAQSTIDSLGLSLPFVVTEHMDDFDAPGPAMGVTNYGHNHKPVGFRYNEMFVKHMTESEAKDLVLHEAGHALVPYKHGHDKTWSKKVREIGGSKSAASEFNHGITDEPSTDEMMEYREVAVMDGLSDMFGVAHDGHDPFNVQKR